MRRDGKRKRKRVPFDFEGVRVSASNAFRRTRISVQRPACAHGGLDHGHGHGSELGILTILYPHSIDWFGSKVARSWAIVNTHADSHLHHTTLVVTAGLESHDLIP